MCDALHYILDNMIRFGSKLYRQFVSIPMGTNCAPLDADLFLFCYERDFMLSLSDNNHPDIVEAFNSTSRYLDDLLNIDNPYLNKWKVRYLSSNFSWIEQILLIQKPSFGLGSVNTNGIISSKIYDKRDAFEFEIVNFLFLNGDVPRSPSYGMYSWQLIRFASVRFNVDGFNNRNLSWLI